MNRHSLRSIAVVALISASALGCSNDGSVAVEAEGSPATRNSVDTSTDKGGDQLADFARAMSQAPLVALTDFSAPLDAADWSREASGIVRGTVESLERGPDRTVPVGKIDGVAQSIPQMTLALSVSVSEVNGAISSSVREGSTIRVLVPIWQGAEEEMPQIAEYIESLVALGLPEGTQLLVAADELTDDGLTYSGLMGAILGSPNGDQAHFIVLPGDGSVWGTTRLEDIATSE